MKSIRIIVLFSATILVLILLSLFIPPKKETPTTKTELQKTNLSKITIGNSILFVEKALNESEWSLGLSGRTFLPSNQGMLFVFPSSEIKTFWMKDTLIPLDIIWVANNQVVGIDHMFPELNTSLPLLKRFISPSSVDKVIETNLNWTTDNDIKINDKIFTDDHK